MSAKAPSKNAPAKNAPVNETANTPEPENAATPTENATQETAPVVPEVPVEDRITALAGRNPMLGGMLNVVKTFYKQMEDARNKLSVSSGNQAELREAVNTSDIPEVVSIREKLAEHLAAVKALYGQAGGILNINVGGTISEDERANLKKIVSEARSSMKNAGSTLENYAGQFVPDKNDRDEAISILRTMAPERAERGTASTSATSDSEAGKIREWAKKNGMKVSERGRISGDVKDAYYKANPSDAAELPNE